MSVFHQLKNKLGRTAKNNIVIHLFFEQIRNFSCRLQESQNRMYKQNNISFLVLVLLSLLLYPGLVKSIHVHEHPHHCCECTPSTAFDHPHETCAVCDFEFVSFISEFPGQLTVKLPEISIHTTRVPEITYLPHPVYYSLRAPPAA